MNTLGNVMHPTWAQAMEPVASQIHAMGDFLREENAQHRGYLPQGKKILRAFELPLPDVRVLIVGQDPYPTPTHPVGLSFSVDRSVRPLPRSLINIYRELHDDLGITPPEHGDLTSWTEQGVMLLNRVLTVTPGSPGSHANLGWEKVTDHAFRTLAQRGGPLVAILWGKQAQSLAPLMPDVPNINTPHPSPLSAHRGFFGSKPFSRANALLVAQGGEPIDWTIV
ncbi:uracil-DNA glycosylase [Arcanobacterium pinnipediorum]|uniref:Uracil-DNA glycosylase n=1 Tax=Arcanobacterium pinnipediorum TaxID=1503041 RepID=A0ABY5AGC8_9ACTO|nr:uracil-DNA glycosylase [Arcanobacterium pinnipediorum]USR79263.1 uracil-DNA glycosylase [Arcanobacterium pinnipediorum]